MRIRVCDLETTGTEPTDKVVEIGAVDLVTETGEIMYVGEKFIDPGILIPPVLSAVHHIIDADVAGAPSWPHGAHDILGNLHSGIDAGAPDAYAAHNAQFERKWLTPELTDGKPWICTLRGAYRVFPEAPGHKNQELRYWLNPPDLDREFARDVHRAAPDAYVIAFLLRALLERASFDDLVRWTDEPALLPRLTFGKHRGLPWDQVPPDYLSWLIRQQDMSEDVRFTAQHYLNRRGR